MTELAEPSIEKLDEHEGENHKLENNTLTSPIQHRGGRER